MIGGLGHRRLCRPTPELDFVDSVLGYIDCQTQAIGGGGFGALAQPGSTLSLLLSAFLTLFVAFSAYRMLFGQTPGARDGVLALVKVGIVLALTASWPAYQALVYDVVVNGPANWRRKSADRRRCRGRRAGWSPAGGGRRQPDLARYAGHDRTGDPGADHPGYQRRDCGHDRRHRHQSDSGPDRQPDRNQPDAPFLAAAMSFTLPARWDRWRRCGWSPACCWRSAPSSSPSCCSTRPAACSKAGSGYWAAPRSARSAPPSSWGSSWRWSNPGSPTWSPAVSPARRLPGVALQLLVTFLVFALALLAVVIGAGWVAMGFRLPPVWHAAVGRIAGSLGRAIRASLLRRRRPCPGRGPIARCLRRRRGRRRPARESGPPVAVPAMGSAAASAAGAMAAAAGAPSRRIEVIGRARDSAPATFVPIGQNFRHHQRVSLSAGRRDGQNRTGP